MFSDFQDDVLGFSFEIGGFWWNTSKHHSLISLHLLLELVRYRFYYFYYVIWTSLSYFVETPIGSIMISLYCIIL
jgi:hypothetical protein